MKDLPPAHRLDNCAGEARLEIQDAYPFRFHANTRKIFCVGGERLHKKVLNITSKAGWVENTLFAVGEA
jgi:hypothetical protein